MNRKELIELWRSREVKEAAALVVEDKALQKVLAAWPMVEIAERGFPELSMGRSEVWDTVWSGLDVDVAGLAALAGLQEGLAVQAFKRARGLRLIYPDGTLHAVAKVVLQKRIRDAVTKGAR